jgi:hypothetical protein
MDELGAAIGFSDVGPAARLRTRGDPDPFHWLDSFSRRKERRKIVQHAHRLDRFDLKLLDLVQQDNRLMGRTLDLGERVGLSATAMRRLAVVGHAPDPAE